MFRNLAEMYLKFAFMGKDINYISDYVGKFIIKAAKQNSQLISPTVLKATFDVTLKRMP